MVVKPTELFMKLFWPFIRLLNGMGNAVVNLLGMRGSGKHAMVHSEEELKMLVTASQEAGVLEEHEEEMLHRVFGFADLTAGQMMVPRTEVVADPGRRDARRGRRADHALRPHPRCRSTARTSITSSVFCTSPIC